MNFKTSLASPYPVQLCSAFGRLVADSFDLLAEAERVGQPIPYMERVTDMGSPCAASWWLSRISPELGLAEMPDPLVPNGDGQPKGLSIREQVAWMHMSTHPFTVLDQCLDIDLKAAVSFELSHEAAVIDEMRAGVLSHWTSRALELQPEHAAWVAEAPERLRPLVSKLLVSCMGRSSQR